MNFSHARIAAILQAAEYSQSDIEFLLSEFHDISFSDFLEAIRYACICTRDSPKISDVTFQVREVELYKEF